MIYYLTVGVQRIKKLTVRIVPRIRVTDRIIFRISKKNKKIAFVITLARSDCGGRGCLNAAVMSGC